MEDLKNLQKKGQASLSNKMTGLVGALIIIVLAVALAPTMFDGIADLGNDTSSAPTWLPVVLTVIVGAGIVFLIWRTFN